MACQYIVAGAALMALALPIGAVYARENLGVFEAWAAFSDPRPRRCFAIAEPERRGGGDGWRPFAAIGTWPARGVHAQLNIRLRRAKRPGAPVLLTIGGQRFALVAGGADAWARNAQDDAAIVAAIRQAPTMRVETRDGKGELMADRYMLRGAATAIDAAILSCARG
jgi:hypothetical protein